MKINGKNTPDKNTSRVKLSAQMSHELLALIILLENKSDIPQTTYNERFDKNKYIMNVDNVTDVSFTSNSVVFNYTVLL